MPFIDFKLGAASAHRLTLHLAGPVLIHRTMDGHHDRKWSEKGHCSLLPAGVPVTRSFKGQSDFIVAHLSPAVVDEVAADVFGKQPEDVHLIDSLAVEDEMLGYLIQLLLTETESKASGTILFADLLSRGLALHLLRNYSSDRPILPPPPAITGWRLRRALDHMRAYQDQNVTLAQLAEVAGLGQTQFARAFRAATGDPPHRYLIGLRIEKARHLLESTKLPIIEVALRCGFDQPNHFATMFRKVTGLTPSAYRKARST